MPRQKMTKPKFNPNKCLRCKYHGQRGAYGFTARDSRGKYITVYCDYASITGSTCLKPAPYNQVEDIRGEDFNNCLLFRKGVPDDKRTDIVYGYENGGNNDN